MKLRMSLDFCGIKRLFNIYQFLTYPVSMNTFRPKNLLTLVKIPSFCEQ